MKLKHIFLLLNCSILNLVVGCTSPKNSEKDESHRSLKPISEALHVTSVKTNRLIPQNFERELLSNGKIEAIGKVNLKFMVDGPISQVLVHENSSVAKGQVLARLDYLQQQRNYNQSLLRYKQAYLDYEDHLLRLGFKLSDTAVLDKNIKNISRIRSGLANAELELQKAKIDLVNTNLKAPFSGKVANLKAKQYTSSNAAEYFCTLINDSELIAEFLVLEQEIAFIRKCKKITISPFNNDVKNYEGTIVSVNPTIDKSGMVVVKAKVKNTDGQLIDGMAVKIKALFGISGQLVIPKSALVERQGRKVVFTLKGNISYWNYVEVADENSSQYVVKSGLVAGDEVIYDGNFNLAHESQVKVDNKSSGGGF